MEMNLGWTELDCLVSIETTTGMTRVMVMEITNKMPDVFLSTHNERLTPSHCRYWETKETKQADSTYSIDLPL